MKPGKESRQRYLIQEKGRKKIPSRGIQAGKPLFAFVPRRRICARETNLREVKILRSGSILDHIVVAPREWLQVETLLLLLACRDEGHRGPTDPSIDRHEEDLPFWKWDWRNTRFLFSFFMWKEEAFLGKNVELKRFLRLLAKGKVFSLFKRRLIEKQWRIRDWRVACVWSKDQRISLRRFKIYL